MLKEQRQPAAIENEVIAKKPAIVEVPVGEGKVLLFATNPCYRWQTWGEFKMMFNTIMHFNDLEVAAEAKPTDAASLR